ncbi:MAG: NYN domain-containing protein [Chloroflexota bacterium]
MITNIYIDGFNFYYGAVKGTPHKWLNFAELCRLLLPRHRLQRFYYFTALVDSRPGDPDQSARQQTYLRALKTLPNLSVELGSFLSHVVKMPLANGRGYVDVIKTQEKGSDVNLAAQMLLDGFKNDYECAVVVSNDSDLLRPIQIAIRDLGKKVGVLAPTRNKHPSRSLAVNATFIKHIRPQVLAASQFPPTLTDANGSFSKPPTW